MPALTNVLIILFAQIDVTDNDDDAASSLHVVDTRE